MESLNLSEDVDSIVPLYAPLHGWKYFHTDESLVLLSVPTLSLGGIAIANTMSQNGCGQPAHNIVRPIVKLHKINFI